jgi:prevent-host-death family protein
VAADESRADSGRRVRGALRPTPEAAPPDYVTIIVVMPDLTLPLAEIKKRLSEIVDGVQQRHDRVVLTRNGRPAAVILSPDDLESLEETLAILSNPSAMQEIREAEAEIDNGDVVTADQLRAKYLTK